ncbi:DUF3379 family protein [Aeromonas cavernicola]|uniref:DUF3379 domain-containing protein n=1 Tax=Aeromonas cavernicola TaxID=1006623 RepID=A0A2H9U7U7_9GAMM|nr:DUF3379 family protein [Aeromonas cavernicola]PJG60072.1 DUF3379 domain-containing protein [Aeromonas cavernicola]
MDELEFRRNAMITPDDQQPDFLAAAGASPHSRAHLAEMKQLDHAIQKAINVDLPDGLAERILLKQALLQDDHAEHDPPMVGARQPTAPSWRQLAIAASIAFILGMSTRWIEGLGSPTLSLADVAMAHLHTEAPFISRLDERVNLSAINAKMGAYGATLLGMGGLKVTYVNHCSFYQGPALHMVMQGQKGPVTLFLVPKHLPLTVPATFAEGTLKGEIVPLKGANMVLIGDRQEPLTPMADQLQSRLHWSI